MAKKKVISYKATAGLAIVGGAISLAAAVTVWLLQTPESGTSVVAEMVGTVGVIAWFLGAAAGVLSLSTPFAKRAIVGLALSGIALLGVLISAMIGG